jgi:hypothetical protein
MGDALRSFVWRCIRQRLIRVVRLDGCNDFLRVDWYVRCSDAVFRCHDEVWFPSRRNVGHGYVVEAFEGWHGSIDFDNYLR